MRPDPPADRVIEEGSDDGDSFASDTPVARGRRTAHKDSKEKCENFDKL